MSEEFEKALDEALKSPTLDEVLNNGKLINRNMFDHRKIEYNGKTYAIVLNNDKCIRFESLFNTIN